MLGALPNCSKHKKGCYSTLQFLYFSRGSWGGKLFDQLFIQKQKIVEILVEIRVEAIQLFTSFL